MRQLFLKWKDCSRWTPTQYFIISGKKTISKHYSNWPAFVVTAAAELEVTELAYFSQVISAELLVLEDWLLDSGYWIGHYYFVQLKSMIKYISESCFYFRLQRKMVISFVGKLIHWNKQIPYSALKIVAWWYEISGIITHFRDEQSYHNAWNLLL